eukprot:comp11630_c0_seq1/m.14675 comp11630_c0_seq1/g.14675  ORF comp11630_c0_seq1/g.14675 comp11630_c0_seq1/m.14675 type:complete len:256 (-) comp11630_c0_seq1:3-770(-)
MVRITLLLQYMVVTATVIGGALAGTPSCSVTFSHFQFDLSFFGALQTTPASTNHHKIWLSPCAAFANPAPPTPPPPAPAPAMFGWSQFVSSNGTVVGPAKGLGAVRAFQAGVTGKSVIMQLNQGSACESTTLTTVVEFICDKSIDAGSPQIVAGPSNAKCLINLEWRSKHACPRHTGISAGWILVILFVVFTAMYMGTGLIYNKAKGMSGWDLLPNRGFWHLYRLYVLEGLLLTWELATCCCVGPKKSPEYQGVV